MQKDQAYHEAAIAYNDAIAEVAEEVAPTLGHPEVQRWCTAVGKQHRFHSKRHQSALNKILARESYEENVEQVRDGLDVPPLEDEEEKTEAPSMDSLLKTEAEAETGVGTLSDGCVKFHQPTRLECDFYPTKGVTNTDG